MGLNMPYKYEEYSIFDIISFVETRGYTVKFYKKGDADENYLEWKKENRTDDYYVRTFPEDIIGVVGTDVYIDIPEYSKNSRQVFAELRFENYPRTDHFEESKKLYSKLRRKFGRPKQERNWGNHPIKDRDKIESYVKKMNRSSQKGWKFWKQATSQETETGANG